MNSQQREIVIQTAWQDRGRNEWDPETHGKGLLSLHIPAEFKMNPRLPLGTPIPPHDYLEFRLAQVEVNGQIITAIVCEGIVVEPTIARKAPRKQSGAPTSRELGKHDENDEDNSGGDRQRSHV